MQPAVAQRDAAEKRAKLQKLRATQNPFAGFKRRKGSEMNVEVETLLCGVDIRE